MKKNLKVALAVVFVLGMSALAGCACSSTAASSSAVSSASSSASATSSASSTSSSSSSSSSASSTSSSSSESTSSSSSSQPKDVVVPDLKGKTQEDAEKALSEWGLVGVASNPEETDEVDPGLVFKQSIAPGTTVKEGEKVAFTVALAPAESEVPDVVGMTSDEAKDAITDAKLNFDHTDIYDDDVEEGRVVSQSVAAGSKVKAGSTVSVAVSLGPTPVATVEVPDVTGYSWDDAKDELESDDLKASREGPRGGTVVSQDIAAGTTVEVGTTVTVYLEKGGQNPVMNFVGNYEADRAFITVDASGDDTATFTVEWGSSASTGSRWTMSGTFDSDTLTVKYTNGKKVDYEYNSNGKIASEKTVYTGGEGTFTFDGNSLTWKDNEERIAKGMTFVYVS